MKKRFSTFILAVALLIGICIPASAIGAGDVSLELILIDASELNDNISEGNAVSEEQFMEEHPMADDSSQDEEPSAYAVRNAVSIHSIKAQPIVLCQETGQSFIINNITRSAVWADGYQTRALRLTTAETTALRTEIYTALANDSTTAQYTWKIAGWHIYTNIYFDVQDPLRIEFRPTCSRYGTFELQTETLVSQYTSWETEYNFVASNLDNEYYFAGIEGDFYFRYTTGSEGGISFYSIFALNSDT